MDNVRYQLSYRKVEADDMDLLFSWANDPMVRKNSFHSEAITYEDHVAWFTRRLSDIDDNLFIFLVDGTPAGQFRLSFDEDEVVLGYSLSSEYRGKGLGKEIIKQALLVIQKETKKSITVISRVKSSNEASRKVFEKLGFTMTQKDDVIEFKMNVS